MKVFLTALFFATAPAHAGGAGSCRVRAEVWEIGNAAWAKALDAMESPEAWRQSLLLAPDARLAGAWVVTVQDDFMIQAGRERIYPVEYSFEVGLSAPPPRAAAPSPSPPATLADLFESWLRARSHKDFEVREEGWHFEARFREAAGGRCWLKIDLTESVLREFVSFGFNPLAMPQPEFSRFSMQVTRSVEPGRWGIVAAQDAPRRPDGGRAGRQRVLLVRGDPVP